MLWGLGLLLLQTACTQSEHPYYTARARIPIGMPIEEAAALLDEAWHHAACPYNEYGEFANHLFFFGSRDFGRAEVVMIRAMGPQDDQVVAWIGTVDESLRVGYEDCIERTSS